MSTDSKSVGAKLLPVVELSKSSSDIERKDENSYLMLDLQYLRDIIFVEDIHFIKKAGTIIFAISILMWFMPVLQRSPFSDIPKKK